MKILNNNLSLQIFNTLNKQTETIVPIKAGHISMYTCGPTVYRDAHIGNLRSYLMADWIRRCLEYKGLKVTHIKNITDVGHMRQEVLEQGEDKIVDAAIKEGKTAAESADFYSKRFFKDEKTLNILPATIFPKATDHINEIIEIIAKLIEKKIAYTIDGNIYFSIQNFKQYGILSGNIKINNLLNNLRIEQDSNKINPNDFTLWKKAEKGRNLKWESPWGEGFPGWHIECSAMSIKYLGNFFDIHTGGVDNIFPHHEDEIAQSEAYTGNSVVKYWIHGQHLLADGVKMSKSSGNSYILNDLKKLKIDPLAFRYLCLTTKYNSRLNFTFSSLKASQKALFRLQERIWIAHNDINLATNEQDYYENTTEIWEKKFLQCVYNNLDLPGGLSITWELMKSDLNNKIKLELIEKFDKILGLKLISSIKNFKTPTNIQKIIQKREKYRSEKDYNSADRVRNELYNSSYIINDYTSKTLVRPKVKWEKYNNLWQTYSSSKEIENLTKNNPNKKFSIGIVTFNELTELKRSIKSIFKFSKNNNIEILIIDNGSNHKIGRWLEDISSKHENITVIHIDHMIGEAEAKNIIIKQSMGEIIILLDLSIELSGNIFEPIAKTLSDKNIGLTGPYGLKTNDLNHFHDGEGEYGYMDAMQFYCFAFRRDLVNQVGFMRKSFRFYRNLDIDYSFQIKNYGYTILADPNLPVIKHQHSVWNSMLPATRDELSKKNYKRFLDKWRNRIDLLEINKNNNN